MEDENIYCSGVENKISSMIILWHFHGVTFGTECTVFNLFVVVLTS